jgi:hypothetical protein
MPSDAPNSISSGKSSRQIIVTAPGPQGASGVDGIQSGEIAELVSYVHNQGASSTEWTVNHNLNFYPNVTVYDSAGSMVEGTVEHTNPVTLKIYFSGAISGKAHLS